MRVPARLQVVEWCAGHGMEFVFFQNRSKIRIIDTTLTYLNFLAEGLAQFMAHLSYRGSVNLHVIIGRRVDVAALERNPGSDKQVIAPREYLDRIEERIAIAKARYLFDGTNQVTCDIRFDSDKKNNYLVLSDYACSCKYTLDYTGGPTWQDYEAAAPDGRTRRAVLEEIFETSGRVFGLLEDRLQHDMRRSLNNRDWGGALFLALSQGVPERGLEEELCAAFQNFDAQDRRTQMSMFFNLVSHLLHARDSRGKARDGSEEAIRLLEAYLPVLERLPLQLEGLRDFCRMNARLYLCAVYTHCGKTRQAGGLLEQCEAALPELLRQPENWDLYYVLRNRQAVIWQDCYCFDKVLELLGEALSVAELQQESQKQLFGLLNLPAEDVPSEQQAKLLGSLALTYQYMLPANPGLAGQARDITQRAIQAFRFPKDKQRHYMTLAEIELRCGQPNEAYQQFCMGLGCGTGGLLEALEACTSPYDWYHAIRLADGLCGGNDQQKVLARELSDLIRSRFDTVFSKSFPAHSAARRTGMLFQKLGVSPQFAQKCFQKCESLCFRPGQDTFWTIGLACLADRIVAALQTGQPQTDALEKRFLKRCTEAESVVQIPALKKFYSELACGCRGCKDKGEMQKFYQWVSDRVGL